MVAALFAPAAVRSEPHEVVAWRGWSDAVLAEAREADKPVLLVIADPACEPCRDEERDAGDDAEAAHLVNAGFVAIAVDRFDRPDLRELYAALLDAPRGQRGALVVFLMPDGRPFAAQWGLSRGDRGASPGLKTLATRRLSDFRNDRAGVEAAASRNLDRLRRAQQSEPPLGPLGRDVVDAALRGLTESFDPASGASFGPGGEVPSGAPRFLLEENGRRPNPAALRIAAAALDRAVARDDRRGPRDLWLDAVVLRALAQSYAASGSAAHRAAAEELATRILTDRRDPKGGFVAVAATQTGPSDDRVIAGWNGLMIGALAKSGSTLGRASDVEAAADAAARLLQRLGPAASLRHSARGDAAGGPAFLDDHAYLADGLLDLHAATGEARWLAEAVALTEAAVGRFLDPAQGGFFATDSSHAPVLLRMKPAFDVPLPSANGVMARVLLRLDRATGEKRYGELARATVAAFRGDLQRAPRGMETLAGAAAEVLAGSAGDAVGDAASRPPQQVVGPITLEASLSSAHVAAGGTVEARLRIGMAAGFRVVARAPGVKDLLGLTVSVLGEGLVSEGVRYPPARQEPGPWNTGSVSVYADEVAIAVPIRVSRRTVPGPRRVGLRVVFQACDASGCKPPLSGQLEVPVTVDPAP